MPKNGTRVAALIVSDSALCATVLSVLGGDNHHSVFA